MIATVNGEEVELDPGATVADVVAAFCSTARGVAVALDREVVPRSRWSAVRVPEGSRVELVTAAAGG